MKASRPASPSSERPVTAGPSCRILFTAIILYPIVAIFAPRALVVLLVVTSLALLFDGRNRAGMLTALPKVPVLLIFAILAWSLVSIAWSLDPLGSIKLWGRSGGVVLCGLLLFAAARKLPRPERDKLDIGFMAAGVLFVVMFAFELSTVGALSRIVVTVWNNYTPWESGFPKATILMARASAALAVVSWLCALAISRRYSRCWAFLFLVFVIIVLIAQSMLASLVAFLCGAAVYAIVYCNSRWGVAILFVGLIAVNAGLVATSFEVVRLDQQSALPFDIPISWSERIHILEFTYQKAAERPLLGWGFDASRAVGQDNPSGFGNNMAIPLHPHNLWGQTWLELGVVGLMLLAGLVAVILARIAALHAGRGTIACLAAVITAYLIIGNISFGMWQTWWLAIAWLNAGFMAIMVAPARDSGEVC